MSENTKSCGCASLQTECVTNSFPPFLEPYNSCKRPYMPLSIVTHKGSVWQSVRTEYSTPGDVQTSWRRVNMAGLVELAMAKFECPDLKVSFTNFDRCDETPAGLGSIRAYDGKLWVSNEEENYSTPSATNPKWSMGYTVDQLVQAMWNVIRTGPQLPGSGSTDYSHLPTCA